MHRTGRSWTHSRCAKLISLPAICIWLLLATAEPGQAQNLQRGGEAYILPPGSMPAWTVPVLRLVSATHVEPTTGIILSDTGLVLVPEDFADANDEIIVLDGGTDIIRNGRPARIERKFAAEGLQVLLVQGLKRRGVTLAAGAPEDGGEIVLTAFPPAELIAEGEPPLSLPASVVVFNESSTPSISSETALPNVTGALVDSCGNLVGVSMADDVQSMESSAATRYQWRSSLLAIFREMDITPREFDCSAAAAEPEPPVEEPEPEPVVEEPVPEEPAVEEPAEEPVAEPEEEEEPVAEELPEAEPEELLPEVLPPLEETASDEDQVSDEKGSRNWLWLLAALALFGLGLFLHRLRKGKNPDPDGPAEDQPPAPGPAPAAGDEEPEATQPLLDSLLVVQGVLTDGTVFEDSCPVSENAINITIGRGDTDLVIDSRAISRQHVSLNGPWRELTVSDLGSSNGTSINGVPCLEGEIMFIEPGDTLVLGDARCMIEIRPRDSAGSVEE